eukprot:3014156-Rhodomonas_salina.4
MSSPSPRSLSYMSFACKVNCAVQRLTRVSAWYQSTDIPYCARRDLTIRTTRPEKALGLLISRQTRANCAVDFAC